MKSNDQNGLYRIGSYAKHLGVTPDFLKHYESYHLINAETSENGYRYYPFAQTFRVFECMKLRNLSVPVRQMNMLLSHSDPDDISAYMEERTQSIRRHIIFEQAILRQEESMQKWYSRMRGKTEDWSILEEMDFLFLPHTNGRSFVDDPRVYDILSSWTGSLPIVKSCQHTTLRQMEENKRGNWGFIVAASSAEEIGLSINEAVQRIHVGKSFIFSFYGSPTGFDSELRQRTRILERLRGMNLEPAGDFYRIVFMSTHIDTDARHYGYYLVPLK